MEDAPQVQSFARPDEGGTSEATAEAEQDAITNSAIVAAAASFLLCARDDVRVVGEEVSGLSSVIVLPRSQLPSPEAGHRVAAIANRQLG